MTETQLPDFEGIPVYSAAAVIRGLGDGLSQAMATDPRPFHPGDRAVVVLDITCTGVDHAQLKDTDGLTRKHVFKASTLTFVDSDVVREALDEQQRKNDELAGIQQLPMDEAAAAELAEADAEAQAAEREGTPEPAPA